MKWSSKSNHSIDNSLIDKMEILLDRVKDAYPNNIITSFNTTHKTLSNRCGEICKKLGYSCMREFLEDFGFCYPNKINKVIIVDEEKLKKEEKKIKAQRYKDLVKKIRNVQSIKEIKMFLSSNDYHEYVDLANYFNEPLFDFHRLENALYKSDIINNDKYNFFKNVEFDFNTFTVKKILHPDKLIDVTVPKICRYLSEKLFMNNSYIKSIKFEEGSEVTEVSYKLFENCKNLEKVDITNSKITKIAKGGFVDCAKLRDIIGIEKINYIEKGCFYNCYSLYWNIDTEQKDESLTFKYLLEKTKHKWINRTSNENMRKYISIRYISHTNISREYTYRFPYENEIDVGDKLLLNRSDCGKDAYVFKIMYYNGKDYDYFPFAVADYPYSNVFEKANLNTINNVLKYLELNEYTLISPKGLLYRLDEQEINQYNNIVNFYNNNSDEIIYNFCMEKYKAIDVNDKQLLEQAKRNFYDSSIIEEKGDSVILKSINSYLDVLYIPNKITLIDNMALNHCFKTTHLIFEKRNQTLYIHMSNYDFLVSLVYLDLNNYVMSTDQLHSFNHLMEIKVSKDNNEYNLYHNNLYDKTYSYNILNVGIGRENKTLYLHPNTISLDYSSINFNFFNIDSIFLPKYLGVNFKKDCNCNLIYYSDDLQLPRKYKKRLYLLLNCFILKNSTYMKYSYSDPIIDFLSEQLNYKVGDTFNLIRNGHVVTFCVKSTSLVWINDINYNEYANKNYIVINIPKLIWKNTYINYVDNDFIILNITKLHKSYGLSCDDIPLILNDDYPFTYDKGIIKEINQARLGNIDYVNFLIEYYEKKNNSIRKNYWKNKLEILRNI